MVSFDQAMQLRLFGPRMDSLFTPVSVKPTKQEIWNTLAAPVKRPGPLPQGGERGWEGLVGERPRTSTGIGRRKSPTRIRESAEMAGAGAGPRASAAGFAAFGGGTTQGRKNGDWMGFGAAEPSGRPSTRGSDGGTGLGRRGLIPKVEYSRPVDLADGLKASNPEVWQSFQERVRLVDEWKILHGFADLPLPKKKKKKGKKGGTRMRRESSGSPHRPTTAAGDCGRRKHSVDPYSGASGADLAHVSPHPHARPVPAPPILLLSLLPPAISVATVGPLCSKPPVHPMTMTKFPSSIHDPNPSSINSGPQAPSADALARLCGPYMRRRITAHRIAWRLPRSLSRGWCSRIKT